MIDDNGHGFDTAAVGALGHQGLTNMRSRMAAIGATIEFTSDASGTRIAVHRPAEDASAESRSEEA